MTFGNLPRFEILDDGTIRARAGVQTNCGGIAAIHVRISPNGTNGISFRVSEDDGVHENGFGPTVPASAIAPELREAIFEGAESAFENSEIKLGIDFELLDAYVHYIDYRESKFKAAGSTAVYEWLELHVRNSTT